MRHILREEWRSPSSLGNWNWKAVLLWTPIPDLPHGESKPVGNTGGVVFWESDPTNTVSESDKGCENLEFPVVAVNQELNPTLG
jgi:hypothetical protein